MPLKIILIISLFSFFINGQYKNIQLNKDDQTANEPTIYINPADPNNIIAGSNLNNVFYSTDKGMTWSEDKLSSEKYGVWGDPCIIIDNTGRAYYFHLSRPPGDFNKWIDRIICQWSTDKGKTWSDPGSYMGLNFPKKQDKEWACYDISKKTNNIYTTWTQFDKYGSKIPGDSTIIRFSYSSDQGVSWSEAIRISEHAGDCADSSNTVEGAVPCVGPNGEIYVSWSGPLGIVFDRSTDEGKTWLSNDIKVTEQYGGWDIDIPGIYRCNGMPITACDVSESKYKGNIYINFSDKRNGDNDCDIFFVSSSDGGLTWCEPKRVNDDDLKNGKHQFMSWMCTDASSGAINVLYYDRRMHEDLNTDVYLARSTDGGETFKNTKISESSFLPDKGTFFGDYVNISSQDDFVACIWQRMDTRKMGIIYCGIDFKNK